jgi:NitT/TauT family transport system ATP-binding protein
VTGAEGAIVLDGVGKKFQRRGETIEAVQEATVRVERGQFVSLVGPSGCGKSTLLRIILGLETPSVGTVLVEGRPPTEAAADVGVMLQTPALVPWKSVRGNVLLPVNLRGLRIKDYQQRADELIEMVGLDGFRSSYPAELSGGMQQRVALCRALLFDPPILVLDEPFGALDHITREQLNDELALICANTGKTAVLVTHDIDEAVYLSDRVVVMSARPGRIEAVLEVKIGKPRDLSSRRLPSFDDLTAEIRRLLGLGSIQPREHSSRA